MRCPICGGFKHEGHTIDEWPWTFCVECGAQFEHGVFLRFDGQERRPKAKRKPRKYVRDENGRFCGKA